MFEVLHASLLNFLEMTFIFIALLVCFQQRRAIGRSPFYMAAGFLLILTHLLDAAEIRGVISDGLNFRIGNTVCYLPVLGAYLVVYMTLGTLAAQHIIIGAVVLFGFYIYLGEITSLQCNWLGYSIASGLSGGTIDMLLNSARRDVNLATLLHLADFFIVPIVYTKLRNWKSPHFVAAAGALFAVGAPLPFACSSSARSTSSMLTKAAPSCLRQQNLYCAAKAPISTMQSISTESSR